ncbi:MAG: hypothetical protein KKC84_02945, partial [Candidatus Omnitrophica bacterium]|nr:hypothetical protein [Candidatus Omnitrophota bacterium]
MKRKYRRFFVYSLLRIGCVFFFTCAFAQEAHEELIIDVDAKFVPTHKIFRPNIDLSGRGFHEDISWPRTLASRSVLETWQQDIGFRGRYRVQYNLWEVHQLSKEKGPHAKFVENYDALFQKVTSAGGVVILNLFGTPAGLGQVLDKRSPPWDMKAFKEVVKGLMRQLSGVKKYAIWYEVWNAPDLDEFFLGRKQEYFNLYRAVAEAARELGAEYKIKIPVGGPSVSGWFQSLEGNTVVTPEKSLIYELIQYCSHQRLPLDFITWHGYTTDPLADKEKTIYKNTPATLIREWLTYFNLDRAIPLIVDEWNYDRSANVLSERAEYSSVAASYLLSRIKNMYEAGLDNQIFFSLEDFQGNPEGVIRNVGLFSFNTRTPLERSAPKSMHNVFRMLAALGGELY